MSENEVQRLEQRVSQLERKLNSFLTRTKKEIVWRKQLEDWILHQFNYDLRLQVELKSLQVEGTDEDLDNIESIDKTPIALKDFISKSQRQHGYQSLPNSTSATVVSALNNKSHNERRQLSTNVTLEPMRNTINSSLPTFRNVPPSITVTTIPLTNSTGQQVQSQLKRTISAQHNITPTHQQQADQAKRKRNDQCNTLYSPPNPVIVSTSNVLSQQRKSPELILLDEDEASSNSRNRPSSSSVISRPRVHHNMNMSNNNSNVDGHMPLNFLGQFGSASSDNYSLRTENADSSNCNADFYMDYIKLEEPYKAENYLSRSDDLTQLQFNIRKILLEYDPHSTAESLNDMITSQQMCTVVKRNVTSAVCDFLMRVYVENPPRLAKESMAESLFGIFPFVKKDVWYNRLPNKNPTGHIEHRVNNMRRSLREQRKRLQQDDGEGMERNLMFV